MTRWTPQEHQQITIIRKRLHTLIANRPQYPEVIGDRKIVRFLRGHDHNLEKVIDMYTKFLNWRTDNKVDEIRDHIVSGGIDHPTKFPNANKILELIPHIVIAPFATDKGGSPICLDQYGFSPSVVLSKITMTEYLEFVTYGLEYRQLILEQLSQDKEDKFLNSLSDEERQIQLFTNEKPPFGVLMNTCVIRDLAGVGFEHMGSQGQNIIRSVVSVASDNYPEMMKKCYMINTPWLFNTLWYFVKGLLAARTIQKVSIIGTNYRSELEADIPLEFIPSQIGGMYTKGLEYEAFTFNIKYFNEFTLTPVSPSPVSSTVSSSSNLPVTVTETETISVSSITIIESSESEVVVKESEINVETVTTSTIS